jgi:hypothetical protein
MEDRDADRLKLLDRLADRVPELDLNRNEIEWRTLDDGHEALLVNGGGIDGGDGAYFANAGQDVHAVGSPAPFAAAGLLILCESDSQMDAVAPKPGIGPRTAQLEVAVRPAGLPGTARRKPRTPGTSA